MRAAAILLLALTAAATSADVQPDAKLRANRDTYHPVVDILRSGASVEVPQEKLDRLAKIPFEVIWGAVRAQGYENCCQAGLQSTRPTERIVGRALTIRYLPRRPDLVDAMQQLAKEGDWPAGYHVRAAEHVKPGQILVVDLGGEIDTGVFFGDISALAAQTSGAKGVILWGATRDLAELRLMEGFPVYARGFHPNPALQIGVDWNIPIRVGGAAVIPGDIVVAEEEAVMFFPPKILDQVLERAERHSLQEEFERRMVREKKHRFRDIYPLNKELREQFEKENPKK